jgi:hypothetical protein
MRAVQVVTPTGPADVEVREVDPPTPGHGDVLVEVHSVGVAFPDLLLSRGEYQFKPEPPFTLGVDFAGVVLDPGSPESSREGSTTFTVGQRVAGVNLNGGAAEQVANPAIFTFALPDTMSYDEGAALPMNYLTALFALEERGGLRAGETVLVHGAAEDPGAERHRQEPQGVAERRERDQRLLAPEHPSQERRGRPGVGVRRGCVVGAGEERRDPGWVVLHVVPDPRRSHPVATKQLSVRALTQRRTPGSRCSPRRRRRRTTRVAAR